MSLKSKIEAVIYASEEPVTLAQFAGLLGEEAHAELDALESQQQTLSLEEADVPADEDALNAETFDTSEVPSPATEPGDPGLDSETPEEAATEPTEDVTPAPATDEKQVARDAAAATKVRDRKLRDYFRSLLDQLIADYANGDRGLEIREVAGGFRLATKPEYHDAVRGFVKSLKPPLKLSLQALETLAVVAYKQPVTAPEISEIRGVDSAGVLGSLITRKLITTAGRKQVIGRPILYKTTKDFLLRFGLKDINELPSIEEFEKMAGELADSEPVQEEIPMDNATHETTHETGATGTPTSVAEIDSAADQTNVLHDTPEDLYSDKSTSPEGAKHEHSDPSEVEPMAEQHSSQADGEPNDDATSELDETLKEVDEHEPYTGSDEKGA